VPVNSSKITSTPAATSQLIQSAMLSPPKSQFQNTKTPVARKGQRGFS
jgi:hypothetical protein